MQASRFALSEKKTREKITQDKQTSTLNFQPKLTKSPINLSLGTTTSGMLSTPGSTQRVVWIRQGPVIIRRWTHNLPLPSSVVDGYG